MIHPIYRVRSFQLLGRYAIRVDFEDGVSQIVDLEDVLRGELYGPLRDLSVFSGVKLDPEAHTLVWPNGADFDPATLHDWPAVAADFAAMAHRWETDSSGIQP
jgi:hypothetical protein